MGLGGIDEEGADIASSIAARVRRGGEFLDADFAFAGFAETGGIKEISRVRLW